LLGIEISQLLSCTELDTIKMAVGIVEPLDFLLENGSFPLEFRKVGSIKTVELYPQVIDLGLGWSS
jgi:hypothetical protein